MQHMLRNTIIAFDKTVPSLLYFDLIYLILSGMLLYIFFRIDMRNTWRKQIENSSMCRSKVKSYDMRITKPKYVTRWKTKHKL